MIDYHKETKPIVKVRPRGKSRAMIRCLLSTDYGLPNVAKLNQSKFLCKNIDMHCGQFMCTFVP